MVDQDDSGTVDIAEFTTLLFLFQLSNKLVENPLLSHGVIVATLQDQLREAQQLAAATKSKIELEQHQDSISQTSQALEIAQADRVACEEELVNHATSAA